MQVCWRGVALYAAMLLCSVYVYEFVMCGPLVKAACRYFKVADLSVAPTKFMQLLKRNTAESRRS
jgi:hypothetical protein